MTIPPDATQDDLKRNLNMRLKKTGKLMLKAGLFLSLFCYLRCLLNPLWVLGLKAPGIFVTALFGCYVGWQYVNGTPAAGEQALLWWAVWAGIMLLIHYTLYGLSFLRVYRNCKKYQQPKSNTPGMRRPQAHPLTWQRNKEGYLQAEIVLQAPQQGLYALRWELTGYEGKMEPAEGELYTQAALSEHNITEHCNSLTEFYSLAKGNHKLGLRLMNRDATAPTTGTLTQLNA